MAAPTTAELTQGDLVASALQLVRGALTAAGMLAGDEVGRDGVNGQPAGPFSAGWLFAGHDADGNPLRKVAGTGLSAVTIHDRNSWASNLHNSQQFPQLLVAIHSDCARDEMGNIAARDADMRCKRIAKAVSRALHDSGNTNHEWPLGVWVNSSHVVQQLSITDIPDSDGAVRGVLRVNVALG